jgi:hypothetical protein
LNAGSRESTAIQRLIGRTRFRIRTQWALEGATTATVLAAATALVAVFAIRAELVGKTTGIYLLIAAGAIIVAGAVLGAIRPLDDEAVARRIDRASNLSDRLSTAIAFRRTLGTAGAAPLFGSATAGADGASRPAEPADDDHTDLMLAAIRDGERAIPRANVRAAAPFVAPRDWRAALGFLAVSALAAGLAIPTIDRTPHLHAIRPPKARPGEVVTLIGDNLLSAQEHLGRRCAASNCQPGTKHRFCFFPQRQPAFTAPFAEHMDHRLRMKHDVLEPQVNQFRHT